MNKYMNKIILIILIILFLFYIINKIIIIKEKFSNNEYILPKIIYGYYDNPNEIINAHIETWKRNTSPEWKIIFLNKDNIKEYVDDDFFNKYKNLEAFRFSDFLRLYLLNKTGGVWIDASTIIFNNNFLNNYYDEMHKNKYDVTVYELKGRTIEKDKPYLENWFIMAPKNSNFIKDLYNEFAIANDTGFLKYKKTVLIPSKINLDNTIQNNSDNTYLMQHAIIHYLFQQNKQYNINIKDANTSMFKIHNNVGWNNKKIIKYILENNNWDEYYAIKLGGNQRRVLKGDMINTYINKLNSF
jgi:hypothetical protein